MRPGALWTLVPIAIFLAAGLPVPAGAEDDLLGRIQPADLLRLGEDWCPGHDGYVPAPEDLRRLASFDRPAVLEVYLGTWCPDSLREVPRLLRILEAASPGGLRLRLYGIDRTKTRPRRLVRRAGLERVPTLILKVDGIEVGRIVETPDTTLEHDLASLFARAGRPAGPPEAE
jgi:thiol-disulfide isomerase/thioredoxin